MAGATVASAMTDMTDKVLRQSPILIPGVTCTDVYDINGAGEIVVPTYLKDDTLEATAVGTDFTDTNYENSVQAIKCENAFKKSKKVYSVVAASMPLSQTALVLGQTAQDVRVARDKGGVSCLVNEGTAASITTAITALNVKEILISLRQELVENDASPTIALVSPDVYSSILTFAGTDFTPAMNEAALGSARVGKWLGFTIIETTYFRDGASYKYRKDGAAVTVDMSDVDIVLYDFEAFSVIDKLSVQRVIDSENFVGAKAQVEIDTSFKVTNADCVLVKKHV